MKIAIDISPLSSGHAVRGIGFYTKSLVEGLQSRKDGNEYLLIKNNKELSNLQPDLIHYPFFDLFFPTAPERNNIPIIVTLHDVTPLAVPELFPKGLIGWWSLQKQMRKLKKVDFIITDSDASKNDIVKFCNISSEKIEPIHLACSPTFKPETDKTKLVAVRQKYNLPEKYIIKVGDINRHKNFQRLFKAIAKTPEVHLVLVGKALDDKSDKIPELVEIIADIKEYQLQDRVHRLGFVESGDMNALYTLAQCTIQNSLYEGFGLPALESMTCATPVIAGSNSSQPEVVGDAGILIDPYSIEETVEAINKIMTMTDQEYTNIQKLSLKQSQKFSVEKMVTETVAVYERFKN